MKKKWLIEQKHYGYQGYFKLIQYHIKHQLFSGEWSATLSRERFERGSAAGVLVYDPTIDKLLFVEQFRIGALEADEGPWMLEPVAGIVEDNELPEHVVCREAMEEAGVTLTHVELIADYYVSPGGCDERLYLYFALADLSRTAGVFGLVDEGEDILVHVVDAEEALSWLQNGKANNAMSIIGLQWFALHRDRYAR